ncbi:MAG: ABA4-like family protein [Paracoccaceae bacterium]
MNWDTLFSLASSTAMLGWAILILAPRRIAVLGLTVRHAIPLALSALYTVLVLGHFAAAGGGYGSIAEVRALFASDPVLLAGWTHYLAFDLLVGVLVADRMDRIGLHRLIQAPILALVFLFGPVGFLLALIAEAAMRALGSSHKSPQKA